MSQPDMSTLQNVKLDDIVHVDYDQNGLKNNFTIIVDILQKLQLAQKSDKAKIENNIKDIKDLLDKNNILFQDNSQLKEINQNIQKDNENLKDEIEKLKQRANEQENNHENLKKDHEQSKDRIQNNEKEIEELKKNIKSLLDKIRELENKVEQLSIPQPTSGGGVDSSAIQKILKQIQDMKDEFVTKDEFSEKCQQIDNHFNDVNNEIEELKKRLNKMEQLLQDLQDQVSNIENKVNNLNIGGSNIDPQELEELRAMIRKRVDNEKFEREINSLRQLIKQLTAIGEGKNVEIVQGLGEEEKKLLDAMNEKLESLEDQVRRLRKDVDNNKNEYNSNKNITDKRLDTLENLIKFKAGKDEVDSLVDTINQLKEDLGQVENLAKDNEIEINKLKRNMPAQQEKQFSGNDGITEDYLLEKLRQQKEELLVLLKALQEEKVSFDDLWKSEAVILEKLDEVAGALLKKLADKVDTKKALLYLEKKINQLFVMINKGGSGQTDGDGLLVKRPLFWSCMSCDKDLNKFQGRMGEYKNWAVFPPKETTPERMGKFGIGYKSLLERSKMRDEKIKMESSQLQQNYSQDQFPPVKTPGVQGQQYENQ